MKTKFAAIYGSRELRVYEFELPAISDTDLLFSVISACVFLST